MMGTLRAGVGALVVLWGLSGTTALAAEVLPAEGLVAVLPAGEVIGDGDTEAMLHVVLRTPEGGGILGAKLRASVDMGDVDDVEEIGDGVYAFVFRPDEVKAPTDVRITVRGRTDALGPIEAVRVVQVTPAPYGRIEVTPNRKSLVLGEDAETTISFELPAEAGPPPSTNDLLVRSSSGDVTRVVPLGGGRFTAAYQTPRLNYPHLAIVSVVDRRNPDTVWGTASIQLQGKVDYPVTAPPGANVILRIGSREFGPTAADASGRATVPVIVPPGLASATQIDAVAGGIEESVLDLRVPDARRLQLFDLPPSVPADSRRSVPVRLVVLDPTGEPDPNATVQLSATAGRVSQPRHLGDGIYAAAYTPPDVRTSMVATVQASLPGSTVNADAVEISLVPPMPARLDLSTEPGSLTAAGTGLKVFASLAASDGSGLPGRALRFRAAGAQQKDAVQDLKGGDYRADFSAEGNTDVLVRVVAPAPASANGPRHLVLLPSREAVPVGGSQTLTLVAADAFGFPVGQVTVDLVVADGGGSVPASVTTDASGFAEIVYEAGAEPGLAVVQASAPGITGVAAFYQADLPAAAPLPPSGTDAWRAVVETWRAAQGAVYVQREGGLPAPVGVADAVAVGAPETVGITFDPPAASPGATVQLDAFVADAAGQGVPGIAVEGFATGGAVVGAFQDLGAGTYRASVTVPGTATDAVKINVVAAGGAALAVVELAVSGDAVAVAPEPEPEKEKPAKEPSKYPRPFLRLRGSFLVSDYSYEQIPGDSSGALLSERLAWGAPEGTLGTTPMGAEASLRVFIPQVPYLGFDARFRYSRYVLNAPQFSENPADNLFAVNASIVGRYPFEIEDSVVHVGLRAGFRYDDIILFRGVLAQGGSVTYEPLPLSGLDVGGEIGAEFWRMYLVAKGTAGFAYGRVPYAGNADLNLGIQVVDNFFVDVGFGYQFRIAELLGNDSQSTRGTISDQQIIGNVGVGVSF